MSQKIVDSNGEDLSLEVFLYDRNEIVFGTGSVNLAVMIEDSCNILRHEIDIISAIDVRVIGSVVADIKGWHLLSELA